MKKQLGKMPFLIVLLGMIVAAGRPALAAPGATTICKWKDNKAAALTLSIDDSPLNNGSIAATDSVLDPRGLKMTWYIMSSCVGQWGSWADYPALIAGGHELGAHPYGTDGTDEPSPDTARARIVYEKNMIEQHCPGNGKCITMAWHYSAPSTSACLVLVPQYMIANRQDTGDMCCFLNSANPSLNPTVNLGMFLLGVSGHSEAAVDEIITAGGWRHMYSHNWTNEANFTALCDHIYNRRDVLWEATVRDVAQYIYERNAATVAVVSAGQAQIVLNLTHSLSTTVCDFIFPLTLKTEVDAGWDSVTVSQGSNTAMVQSVNESGKQYVYFDAQPNKGQITLAPKGQTAVAAEWSTIVSVKNQTICTNPVKIDVFCQYMQSNKKMLACNLAGKIINREQLHQPGVYLVWKAGENTAQKVVMVR